MSAPIPMILFCPDCGLQHIDEADPERGWSNPPHRTHLCHGCGHHWRPADVETCGVADIATRGAFERDRVLGQTRAADENARLHALLHTPEVKNFQVGVNLEAAHQVERWGADHDEGKGPLDWFWLIGFLAQKAATAELSGDLDKAKHHTISTAAALLNWHRRLAGAETTMRPGIATPKGEA